MLRTPHITESGFKALIDGAPCGVTLLDRNSRFTYLNRRFTEIFGYTLDDLPDLASWTALVKPERGDTCARTACVTEGPANHGARESVTTRTLEVRCKTGTHKIALIRSAIGDDGTSFSSYEDITAQRISEQELRESKLRLEMALRASSTGLWDWDLKTDRVWYSPEWKSQLGYRDDELSNDLSEWQSRVHPNDFDRTMSTIRAYIGQPGDEYQAEFRLRHRDGTYRWVLAKAMLLRDAAGTPCRMMGSHVDITDRKDAETRLLTSVQRFRNIVEASPIGMHIYRIEQSGRLVFIGANPAADTILGIDHRRLLGLTIEEAFPPLRTTEIPEAYRRVASDGIKWSADEIVFEHGPIKGIFEVTAFQISPGEMAAAFTEVSGPKVAEQALRQSQTLLRQVIDLVPHFIFVKDGQSRYLLANEAVARAYGTTVADLVGKSDFDFSATPDEARRFRSDDAEVISSGRPKMIPEESITDADGEVRLLHTTKIPFGFGPSCVPAVLGVAIDITEQRRIEHALRQSEEKYRLVVENASEGIFIAQDGLIKFPNPRMVSLIGYSLEDLSSIPFVTFIHPEDRETVVQRHTQRLQGLDVPSTYVFRALTRSGETRWVELTSILINWEARPASLVFLRDVTDHKKLEAQLFQAQKMEAVGQLAGGIAHDFNNFLTAIIGYANLSLMKKPAGDPTKVFIEQILSAAEKAAQLTQNLLAFGRKQLLNTRPIDVNETIGKVARLLVRLIGEDVELKTTLTETPAVIMADAGQLEQVLMNLATNARDAMPKGGSLVIATGLTSWSTEFVRVQGYGKPGRYVTIAVSDTGQGMDELTRQRIFEPFFTTKELGKGTGLGLSMVYGIVKQHEGYVNVESLPGQGSAFTLYFPACLKETAGDTNPSSSLPPPGGVETILLAEDEPEVRQVLSNVLREFGYRVVEAVNGEDAAIKFRARHDEIQLVISDVIMPRKNGMELYNDLREVNREMKVLFLSGYPADTIGERRLLDPNITYVDKPVSPLALLTTVRDILKN